MNYKSAILSVFLVINGLIIRAQDLHNSNYRYAPLTLNPALSGHFQGNVRLSSTYRDQGRVMMVDGFKTITLGLDVPYAIKIKGRKYDWLGFGLNAFRDESGSVKLNTNGVTIGTAYHFTFDKKYSNVLSIGIQYGSFMRKVDENKILLESDVSAPGFGNDRNRLFDYNATFNDIDAGISFRHIFRNESSFSLGTSIYNIKKSKSKGIVNENYIDRRFTFYGDLYSSFSPHINYQCELIASKSSNSTILFPQFKIFYLPNKNKKIDDMLYGGIGVRVNDALVPVFGIRYKKWDVGLSYDITISSLANYNEGSGGFEIGLVRIFNIPKRPKIDPVLICPDL